MHGAQPTVRASAAHTWLQIQQLTRIPSKLLGRTLIRSFTEINSF